MRRIPVVFASLFISLAFFLFACTKIDTTTLGADLIPAVDNIHTFELTLDVQSDNKLFNDTTGVLSSDDLPAGYTNDPEFGQTKADLYFDISIPVNKNYPFGTSASLVCDSVILSLSYKAAYGDTNSVPTLRVFELSQASGFSNDSLYRLNHPDFATTGSELGNRSFTPSQLHDTVTVIRKDTTKVVNVLRIPLAKSFGTRLMSYDTTFSANGGYYNDSLFKTLFRGFAIKADQVGNALTYFKVNDANTKLIVYYHGATDTSSVEFFHAQSGLTNILGVADNIKRTPGGGWNTYINNGDPQDDLLYIPVTPGSYGLLKIPQLDTLSNKVIHLAELILPKVASAGDDQFKPPAQIFLDMVNSGSDTAFTIPNDFVLSNFGYNFEQFGGFLRSYAGSLEYRFNISRHIQSILTKHAPNFDFRVYAPFETNVYYLAPGTAFNRAHVSRVNIPIVPRIAAGRVVLGGGNNSNPAQKARLRIVYSNI